MEFHFRFPKFLIPDFPLGALLIVILFAVGLLAAFPDVPFSWAWDGIVALAVLLWVAGAGVLGSRPNEVAGLQKSQPPQQDKEGPPSADFAALIDAITTQGAANRDEERREERGKQFREFATIVLLAMTVVAVFRQIDEMQKVYAPIKAQADAAHDNMIADHRAWIGPLQTTIDTPAIGMPIHTTTQYSNSGKQPAPTMINGLIKLFTTKQWDSGEAADYIHKYRDSCFGFNGPFTATAVAFPTVGAGYNYDLKTFDKETAGVAATLVDQDILDGKKIITEMICIFYTSYNVIRHTSVCGYYLKGRTPGNTLSYCVVGNDAD